MTPKIFGAGIAILAIIWAVMGLISLWEKSRRHRREMDLYEAQTAYMQKLAAEARARRMREDSDVASSTRH